MEGKGKAALVELLSENKVCRYLNALNDPKAKFLTFLIGFVFVISVISGLSVSKGMDRDRIKEDTTPPSVDITNPGNYISSFGITLFWSGSDQGSGIEHYETKLDDNSYIHVQKRTEYCFNSLDEGTHTAYVKAFDNAGNSAVESVDFVIDRTIPEANAGSTYSGDEDTSILFSAYSSSDSITSVVEYEWDWENDGIYDTVKTSYKASHVFEDPGEYTVKLRVWDKADNTDTDTASVTVYDVTPPSIDLGGPYSGDEGESISFSVTGADNVGIVQYDWDFDGDDDYDIMDAGSSTTHSYGEAGDYTVKVRAEDAEGNTAKAAASVSVESIDDIPPIVTIESPKRSETVGSRFVDVEWTGSDRGVGIDHYSIKYGSGFWEDVGTSTSHHLDIPSEGEHIIYVKAVDGNGNTAVDTVNVISDLHGPFNCCLDAGDGWTDSRNVSLSFIFEDNISAVESVRVGVTPDFSTDRSRVYSLPSDATFELPSDQDNYTLYARFEDSIGHRSQTVSTWVIYDVDRPDGGVNIEEGERTIEREISYTLNGSDNLQKIAEYRLKVDDGSWSSWMEYEMGPHNVNLSDIDGKHVLKVRLRTRYGQESDILQDSILLDLEPPMGSVSIEGRKNRTTDFNVSLDISASDDHGSITHMRLWNGSWSDWIQYEEDHTMKFPDEGIGRYEAKAQFRDDIGDVSEIVNDTIFIDPYSPVGSLSIDGGAEYSFDYNVSLNLSAYDESGEVVDMRIWHNGSWGPWIGYKEEHDLEFPHLGTGNYTVRVQYKDDTGNTSSIYEDSITIDPNKPRITVNIEDSDDITIERTIDLNLSRWDDLSDVDEIRLSLDPKLEGVSWQPYKDSKEFILPDREGLNTIYLQGRTSHGQLTEVVNDTIFLDKTMPSGSVEINQDRILNSTVHAGLPASDNVDTIEQMRFATDGTNITEVEWVRYEGYKWIEFTNDTGEHTLSVQYKTSNGQLSEVYNGSVIVDLMHPYLNASFENDPITRNNTIVSLDSGDNYGKIQEMRFSYLNKTTGWIDYSEEYELTINADGTGEYQIKVEVRDGLNDTAEVTSEILFDLEKPIVDFNIDESFTGSRNITLEIDAYDELSEIEKVRINISDDLSGTYWVDFKDEIDYDLPDKDGNYTVYLQVITSHGQRSTICSDSVITDTHPPSGTLDLVDGSVSSDEVNLLLNASDNCDKISIVEVSLYDDFSVSEIYGYSDEIRFEIREDYGYQDIYVKYITKNGQVSEIYTEEVFFDNRGPEIDSFEMPDKIVCKENLTDRISWEAYDDSGIQGYEVYVGSSEKDISLYDELDSSGFSYDFEDNDTVVMKVKAVDNLGNTNSITGTTSVDVNYPPRILSEDIPRNTEDCNIEFALTADDCKDDELMIEWYIDGVKIGTGNKISREIEEGDHSLIVKVTDGKNTISKDYSITAGKGKTGSEPTGIPIIPLLMGIAALIVLSGGSYYFYMSSKVDENRPDIRRSIDISNDQMIMDVIKENQKATLSEICNHIQNEKGVNLPKEEVHEVCEELVREEKVMKAPRLKTESEYIWPNN